MLVSQRVENRHQEVSVMELGRYFNSKDEPIVLSKDHSHARLVLTRGSRTSKRNSSK